MPDWLTAYLPEGWGAAELAIVGVVAFVSTMILSLAVVGLIIMRIPEDYFIENGKRHVWPSNRYAWIVFVVFKNIVGLFLIALGIVLSLPGVPGQGLLTILIGVMLMDFPCKRRFERWLATRKSVMNGMNALRRRFGRPPIQSPSNTQHPVA